MQQKFELNASRDFNEIVSDTILFFKQTWKPLFRAYFSICGVFMVVSLVVAILNQIKMEQSIAEGTSRFTIYYFLSLFIGIINGTAILTTVLSFIVLYKDKGNETPVVEEVWSYFKFYFIRILGAVIVLTVCNVLGFVFCLIPGIYLLPVFGLICPIIVMENGTFGYAFNRAFKLMKKEWWRVFGALVVISIVCFAATVIFLAPVMLLTEVYALVSGASIAHIYQYPLLVITQLLQFLNVLPIIAITLAYYSLTEQKEGTSLNERIDTFGTTGPTSAQLPAEEF